MTITSLFKTAALCLASAFLQAQNVGAVMEPHRADLGQMKVFYLSGSTFKRSLDLRQEKTGNEVRIDCSAFPSAPGSTLVLLTDRIRTQAQHEVFGGVSDFYCSGLLRLSRDLTVGDTVDVSVDFSTAIETDANEPYEVLTIGDIVLKKEGDRTPHRLKENPGTIGVFRSAEPLPP